MKASSGKARGEANVSLPILILLFVSSLWMAGFATVSSESLNDQSQISSRMQLLLDGPPLPVVTCLTRAANGLTMFECEADSWGSWELSWKNPDTLELTFLEWEAHNKSIGKQLTTNPGELVVKYSDANGNVVVKTIEIISTLQLCKAANHCYIV